MTDSELMTLDATEAKRLSELETVIGASLQTFADVGYALCEIRDSRLYRVEFSTFEDYCRDRWGFNRAYANRLILSAEVVANLDPFGSIPTTESQARPLTVLEPDQQRAAWQRAIDTAPNHRITAAHVENVARELFPSAFVRTYTPSNGNSLNVDVDDDDSIETVTQRVGRVLWEMLANGLRPTTQEVAVLCCMTHTGAWYMMNRLVPVVPVYLADDGYWRLALDGEQVKRRHYVAQV